ncbi:MAG: hypothetical protein ABFS41_04270 [Myxococcota bacterium]
MPAPKPLHPLDETTLRRMIRYALQTGGTSLHLKPGCRPCQDGMGGARELRFRQLTGDDTSAAAACLLAQSQVPERLRGGTADAAERLYLFWELPGEALVEPRLESVRGGLALHLDLIPPIPAGVEIEAIEP